MIIGSVTCIFGQNTTNQPTLCTDETVQKISSRGISLGMTLEETLDSFVENNKLTGADISYPEPAGKAIITPVELELQPKIEKIQGVAKNNFGYVTTVLFPKDKERFDGIELYYLGFLDNRLAFFRVNYLKPKWENLEQFVRTVSPLLNLPIRENFTNLPYSIKCGDYTVEFSRNEYEAQYSLSVSKNINEIVQQRRKKAEDEQREREIKAFKP